MEKTKVMMIGCGGRNGVHFSKLCEMPDVEFVAFCDVLPERAQKFADTVGYGKVYDSHEKMLAEVTADVAFIAVPPHQHGAIEFALIEKGIPFQVEKPMAMEYELAEKIYAAAQAKGLILNVGFQDRYQDLTDRMKAYLADKKVGLVTGSWIGGIPGVPWWRKMETSGGQIVEQNIHLFDQLRWLFGEPESVYCTANNGITDTSAVPGFNVDEYSSAIIRFKCGVVANLMTGCYIKNGTPGAKNGLTVFCTDARLEYILRRSLTIFDENGEEYMERDEAKEQTGVMDRAYIDAIRAKDGSRLRSPYSDALKSLKLTLACNESIQTGKVVAL